MAYGDIEVPSMIVQNGVYAGGMDGAAPGGRDSS